MGTDVQPAKAVTKPCRKPTLKIVPIDPTEDTNLFISGQLVNSKGHCVDLMT